MASEADARQANVMLRELQSEYRLLDGVTVRIGSTPRHAEAIAYYTRGEIVINTGHTVTLERILAHEIWHIIDWRDNGQLDWGEELPPPNRSDYRRY